MLEWKAWTLTLLITFTVVIDRLSEILANNWNW
jgi:hypothetical protein